MNPIEDMSYKIVYAWYDSMSNKPSFEEAIANLNTAVNKAVGEGWEPAGGIAIRVDAKDRYQYLVQAMIKRLAS